MKCHNQARIVYRNICSKFGLELCTFQIEKHLMANEWGIVVVDIADKKAVAIDVALSSNSNI